MKLVDANILINAVNEEAEDHETSRRWLDHTLRRTEAVGFSWIVLLSFIRVTTHPAVFPNPLAVGQSGAVVEGWLDRPAAILIEPTRRHLSVLRGLLAQTGTAANLVNDAHLAALALERDATIVSFDHDFGRFSGLRWERPHLD